MSNLVLKRGNTLIIKQFNQIISQGELLRIKLWFRRFLPSSILLKHQYKKTFGRKLDLKNPQTYNEKLQWLKLHDHNPLYTQLVDKYEVKKWVSERIGEKYIIPTISIWQKPDDIDFDFLPNKFVLKATHDSGSYCICDDKAKFDCEKAKRKLAAALNENFYYAGREWPYKNVQPRIIAEEYIGYFPMDFKFFVFDGVIDSIMVCKGREEGHPDFYFYDLEWKRLYYQHDELEKPDQIEKPENLSEMINIVEKLTDGFRHVRLDLYNVDGKIFFGEYTFYDQGGLDTDISYQTDLMWGNKLKLTT